MRTSPLPPPIWMLVFGVLMWAVNRYWPVATVIPAPWNRVGWCVIVLAFIPPFAAITAFGHAGTTADPLEPESATALVTSGVYAWTRALFDKDYERYCQRVNRWLGRKRAA